MATRILVFDNTGAPIYALDGHHGTDHAERWLAQVRAQLAGAGVEPVIVEIEPAEGGETVRREVIGCLHCARIESRRRPDGAREIVSLLALADHADARRAAVAMPRAVRCGLRVLAAPADWIAQRKPLRRVRNRLSGEASASPEQLRLNRRARRAAHRETAG